MTVSCLLLLWVYIHYSFSHKCRSHCTPLFVVFNSFCYVPRCLSGCFAVLNAIIDCSGKPDFILSDLWRIDIICWTISLTSDRKLEYVMTKTSRSFFFFFFWYFYGRQLVCIQVGVSVSWCQLCSRHFISLLEYLLFLSWPTSFLFFLW